MSRKNHKWTQSDIDKLLKMRADGKSNAEAAEYFGCSRQNICSAVTRFTAEKTPPKQTAKPKAEHFCKGCWAGTFTDEGIYKCMFPKHCERKDGKL